MYDPQFEVAPLAFKAGSQNELLARESTQAGSGAFSRAGGALLQLQRTHGNRYVQQVVNQARQTAQPAPVIQTKLVLGAADNTYEREADRVAQQVIGQSAALQTGDGSAEATRVPSIQRLSRAAGEAGAGPVDAGVQQAIQSARGGGQPLPEAVRAPMEQALGADFGGVRVHTGAQADQLNQSLQARAFTTGRDIFFRRGYAPTEENNQHLLAHELTHVVQQAGDNTANKPSKSAFHDARPNVGAITPVSKGIDVIQRYWIYNAAKGLVYWVEGTRKGNRDRKIRPPSGWTVVDKKTYEDTAPKTQRENPMGSRRIPGWTDDSKIKPWETEENKKAVRGKRGGGGGALAAKSGGGKLVRYPSELDPEFMDVAEEQITNKSKSAQQAGTLSRTNSGTNWAELVTESTNSKSPLSGYEFQTEFGTLMLFDLGAPTTQAKLKLAPDLSKRGRSKPNAKALKLTGKCNKASKKEEITPKRVDTFASKRADDGQLTGTVMGESARDAAYCAGYEYPPKGGGWNWQWLHIFAYSLGGADGKNPDRADNLVVGTSYCNGAMELVEATIAEIVRNYKIPLHLETTVTMSDDDYHIGKTIDYTVTYIHEEGGQNEWESLLFSQKFDCLSLQPKTSGDKPIATSVIKQVLDQAISYFGD